MSAAVRGPGGTSTEVSVSSSYSVVYKLDGRDWKVAGDGGWSEVHLYYDEGDGRHRLVAWTVDTQQVLINANVTADCTYKTKAADFHKFADESGVVYGFGFHKSDQSVGQAAKFLTVVTEVIENAQKSVEPTPITTTSQAQKYAQEHGGSTEFTSDFLEVVPMGKLSIVPSKHSKLSEDSEITDPYGVVHTKHAKFDPKSRKYTGVPLEWLSELQKQFGLDPASLERSRVDGYADRIPCILVQLWDYLKENGGLESVGIFRLAPDQDESKYVKQELNEGSFERCRDVNVIANLIKVWCRELPTPLLSACDTDAISACSSVDQVAAIIDPVPEPCRSILLYMLDGAVDVAALSSVNKMSPQNLAIVIAPNLYRIDDMPPHKALLFSQKVALFLQQTIIWRARTRPNPVDL